MWQSETFDRQTIDQELGWAEQAGYNSLRVFLQFLVWEHEPQAFKKRIDEFLDLANQHGLTVMFVLFDETAVITAPEIVADRSWPVSKCERVSNALLADAQAG